MTGYPRFRDEALCAQTDPDAWFPDRSGNAHAAKRICAACPVRAQCLAWALDHDEPGIWGGTSETERRRMRRGTVSRAVRARADRDAAIYALADTGIGRYAIAAKLNVPYTTVSLALQRRGRAA